MPTYIELDKQTSLPSAVNAAKAVFGINSLGEPELKYNNGDTYNYGTGSLFTTASIPYREYLTGITQVGSNAPTTDYITTNTLGITPVWEYIGVGEYRLPLNTAVDSKKLISYSTTDYNGDTPVVGYKVTNDAAISASNFSTFDSAVRIIVPQSDGKILVGGEFTNFNGTGVNRIIRLNSDASIDSDFSYDSGFDGTPLTIAVQSDGKILVGGNFGNYNDTAANRIIRLNTSGSIDNTFNIGTGFNDFVYTIAIQSDGKIIVGGLFSDYDGTSSNCIIRLNTDGSVDNIFNIGSGTNATVYTIAIQSDGKILVGGDFSDFNSNTVNYVIRLNSDGSIDNTFTTGTGFDISVYTITIQSDGKILIGGRFTDYNGTTVRRIIRLNTDGSIDNRFNIGTGFDGGVFTITEQFDGKILVGGEFGDYDGYAARGIARLNTNGSNDNTNFLNSNPGFNNPVSTIATLENGNILAGGEFTRDTNDTDNYYYMALINNQYYYQLNTTTKSGGDDLLNQQQLHIKLYN